VCRGEESWVLRKRFSMFFSQSLLCFQVRFALLHQPVILA
jgi:hypothetical protein